MNKNTKEQTEKKEPRQLEGVVVSNEMDKTVVVRLEQIKKHPLYKKRYAKHAKIKAHDPENEYDKGDQVKLIETKPYSKTKTFRVLEKTKEE